MLSFEMYEERCVMLSMRFPQKLWRIVNECKSGAICWGSSGSTILLNYKKFQEEFLTGENSIFKTSNITSFIRQLNLYGFRKVTCHIRDPTCSSHNPNVHEFLHEHFRNGHIELLSRVCRKAGSRNRKPNDGEKRRHLMAFLKLKDNEREIQKMSRLQICQLALKEALEQAVQKYQDEKSGVKLQKNVNTCDTQTDLYYCITDNLDSPNDGWENTTITVPKTDAEYHLCYDEVLYTISSNNTLSVEAISR